MREIRLSAEIARQLRLEIVIASAFLLMFAFLLLQIGDAVTVSTQPPENRAFGVFMVCFVTLLVAVVAWKILLLAVHAKYAIEDDGTLLVGRILAPEIRLTKSDHFKHIASAVPSIYPPYYKRGTVVSAGWTVFYVSDHLPGASALIDRLLKRSQ